MRTKTTRFTVQADRNGAGNVSAKSNGNLLAITASGDNVWFPKEQKQEDFITYKVHEKGDSFTATRDSSRTKGAVLGIDALLKMVDAKATKVEDLEEKQAEKLEALKDEPLYLSGEKVTRLADTVEFVGFTTKEIKEELSFEDKAKILAGLGVAIHI